MTRYEKFVQTVERRSADLRDLGLARIGLFGSAARCDDDEASDFDVLVEFSDGKLGLRNYMRSCMLLEEELGKVDVLTRGALKGRMKKRVERDCRYVKIPD